MVSQREYDGWWSKAVVKVGVAGLRVVVITGAAATKGGDVLTFADAFGEIVAGVDQTLMPPLPILFFCISLNASCFSIALY